MRNSNRFYPIDGYVLLRGYAPIAAFGDFLDAQKAQHLFGRDNPGTHYTIISEDGYSTFCAPWKDEAENSETPTTDGNP